MLFWEIVPKYDSEKKLLPEMILVSIQFVKISTANRYAMLYVMT